MSNKRKARAWSGVSDQSVLSGRTQLEEVITTLANAYETGRYELPPDELVRQLNEYASGMDIDYLVGLLGWEGGNLYSANIDSERKYAIKQSQHAWRHSPLYQWSVWAWTNWGTGESVQVTPTDEAAQKVFAEFWGADRNAAILGQDNIHAFSEWLLVTGDRYLVHFVDTSDGDDTIRNIPPAQFPDAPITDPRDASLPLFYKRQWTSGGKQQILYYPSWEAFFNYPEKLEIKGLIPENAKRSDEVQATTAIVDGESRGSVAVIQHVAHNRKAEDDLRGWPLGTISGSYQDAHKRFMEGRLTVAQAKAMFVRRKQVSGGSRGLSGVKSALQSSLASSPGLYPDTNPTPVAGTELDNKMVSTTDLPMTTGASDAATDNKVFSWMALLGDGLFPTSAGLDTARFATALAMDKNQAMLWSRYKSFIAQQLKNMVKIVLLFKEKYNNDSFPDKSSTVTIDTLSIVDFPPVVTALSEMFERALTPLVEAGIMPVETARGIAATAWGILLQALGVENAGDLIGPDMFTGDVEPVDDDETPDDDEQAATFAQELAEQRARTAGQLGAIERAADDVGAAARRIK